MTRTTRQPERHTLARREWSAVSSLATRDHLSMSADEVPLLVGGTEDEDSLCSSRLQLTQSGASAHTEPTQSCTVRRRLVPGTQAPPS